MIDRRRFLGLMIGGVAGEAAVRTFPFRVYSFPSQIIQPKLVTQEQHFKLLYGSHRIGLKNPVIAGLGDVYVQPLWDHYDVAGELDRPLFRVSRPTNHKSRATDHESQITRSLLATSG